MIAEPLTVLVVDDDYRVTALHVAFVDRLPGFVAVGEAHTAAEAVELTRSLHPDVVLLDVYLPDGDNAWRIALADQALRRILAALRDWSPLIGRSNNGTTALIVLSEIRKDLMELSYKLELGRNGEAEILILSLRQRLRILAYFFEDLSRNSTGKDTTTADTPFRPEVLLRMWPLPPLGEEFDWAADQEAIPGYRGIWQSRLQASVTTLVIDAAPIMTVAIARQLAISKHAGQLTKQGMDYFQAHIAPIAERLESDGDNAVIAGLLHDIVEDTDMSLSDLLSAGASFDVVHAVDSVSKRDGEPYEQLIARAAANPLGRRVKLADNAQNIADNPSLAELEPETAARLMDKYHRARQVLVAAEQGVEDGT